MPEAHASFHSTNGKRRILIVDDERINREILGSMLQDYYEIVFAEDGADALHKIRENKRMLSLILLDLIMPNMTGQQVLEIIKNDPQTKDIPVIVATSDETQEIECLDAGAIDFIRKPYPDAGVILARVRRIIELSEDRQILQTTERDPLTGLFNREFFYGYAEQFDQHHPDLEMDAIVLDINHFSILNERYGRAYADGVLRRVGEKAREIVHDAGGIVCRREADIFQIYCPHREDYKAILDSASQGLAGEHTANNRVRLRMGIYSNVDKNLSIERRFDRAKIASDSVRSSFTRTIGLYDDTLRKSELYAAQLIEDFHIALEKKEFKVYYQPKFDIRSEEPMLTGAEALVRWDHPEFGMVSPGVFIPLFEENGLIQELDKYVWTETARQIRAWKDQFGFSIPVSVNVSRIDMYDHNIIYTLMSILERYHLDTGDLHLEVTETAYTEDSDQIIEAVKRLRAIGFAIEMDDFGTGYSSLNMLNTLPIDALKLDMIFIRSAFAAETNTQMLEIIIEIADNLSVPAIAEGIETEEQLRTLQELGCDMGQGYYFSPPVPPDEFEPFLDEMQRVREEAQSAREDFETSARKRMNRRSDEISPDDLSVSGLSQRYSFPLRNASVVFVMAAFLVAVALFLSNAFVNDGYRDMDEASDNFIRAEQATMNLEIGSDYLTEQVRLFTILSDIQYLENYFTELNVTKRRDKAVTELEALMQGSGNAAYEHLSAALRLSNELVNLEYHAMKLVLESGDYDEDEIPEVLMEYQLPAKEEALSDEQKQALAKELVLGPEYMDYKSRIKSSTAACAKYLITTAKTTRNEADVHLSHLLTLQSILIILLLLVVFALVLFISFWVRRPLSRMVTLMKAHETVPPSGAEELRFVSETYNTIFEENRRTHERLTYGNMHDTLTGLYNRNAYDLIRNDIDMSNNALLLVDVDKFKSINDTYGHDIGDMLLKRVAEVLEYTFRSSDLVFRIGGDEFVVIMTFVDSSMRHQVEAKIEQANVMLQRPVDDLPPTSLSVGVAFSDRENPEGDIFKDADTALYRVKQAGRCGCYIY